MVGTHREPRALHIVAEVEHGQYEAQERVGKRLSQPLGRASARMIEGRAPVSSFGVISRIRASSNPTAAGIVYCRYTGAKTRCTRIFRPCRLGSARGDRAASGTPRVRFPTRER